MNKIFFLTLLALPLLYKHSLTVSSSVKISKDYRDYLHKQDIFEMLLNKAGVNSLAELLTKGINNDSITTKILEENRGNEMFYMEKTTKAIPMELKKNLVLYSLGKISNFALDEGHRIDRFQSYVKQNIDYAKELLGITIDQNDLETEKQYKQLSEQDIKTKANENYNKYYRNNDVLLQRLKEYKSNGNASEDVKFLIDEYLKLKEYELISTVYLDPFYKLIDKQDDQCFLLSLPTQIIYLASLMQKQTSYQQKQKAFELEYSSFLNGDMEKLWNSDILDRYLKALEKQNTSIQNIKSNAESFSQEMSMPNKLDEVLHKFYLHYSKWTSSITSMKNNPYDISGLLKIFLEMPQRFDNIQTLVPLNPDFYKKMYTKFNDILNELKNEKNNFQGDFLGNHLIKIMEKIMEKTEVKFFKAIIENQELQNCIHDLGYLEHIWQIYNTSNQPIREVMHVGTKIESIKKIIKTDGTALYLISKLSLIKNNSFTASHLDSFLELLNVQNEFDTLLNSLNSRIEILYREKYVDGWVSNLSDIIDLYEKIKKIDLNKIVLHETKKLQEDMDTKFNPLKDSLIVIGELYNHLKTIQEKHHEDDNYNLQNTFNPASCDELEIAINQVTDILNTYNHLDIIKKLNTSIVASLNYKRDNYTRLKKDYDKKIEREKLTAELRKIEEEKEKKAKEEERIKFEAKNQEQKKIKEEYEKLLKERADKTLKQEQEQQKQMEEKVRIEQEARQQAERKQQQDYEQLIKEQTKQQPEKEKDNTTTPKEKQESKDPTDAIKTELPTTKSSTLPSDEKPNEAKDVETIIASTVNQTIEKMKKEKINKKEKKLKDKRSKSADNKEENHTVRN